MPVRVCILSMQRVDNMGSLLQAYGLKKMLEETGCDVEFIDIERNDDDYQLLGNARTNYLEEFERTGIIGKFSKIDRFLFIRLKTRKLEKIQHSLFEDFRIQQLKILRKSPFYDICVIGSDEVFNCLNAGTWGFTTQLFGNVPQAKKVITYAASCGASTYSDLPLILIDKIRETFEKINAFSVRDRNTHLFVSYLTKKKVTEHLDPVLVYDFAKELKGIEVPVMPKHYCIIYSYRNRIHIQKEIQIITGFCEKNHLIPVAVGAPQFWIKNFVVCTPFQCLKLFQNADFVITDTFHGTIFSIKYAKKFAVLTRGSNQNKLIDLIERMDISSHLMQDLCDLQNKYSITKSKAVEKIIIREQIRTRNYLIRNILE